VKWYQKLFFLARRNKITQRSQVTLLGGGWSASSSAIVWWKLSRKEFLVGDVFVTSSLAYWFAI
jgi:hypothetical protein